MDYNKLKQIYSERYTIPPRVFRSPGRINIIGEHTDYNDGFVFPAAIDKEIVMLMAVNNSNRCQVYSVDENQEVVFDLDDFSFVNESWAQYIIGVFDQLQKAGYSFSGVDCVFGGDIPIGAGLSSSAALECVTAFALNELFQLSIDRRDLVKMAQKAENEYVGVNCGIMDQFASMFSKKNHALKLDCRSMEYQLYSLDLSGYQLVLVDSMVKHSLASSEYNVRRTECETGVAQLRKDNKKIYALRDATLDQLFDEKEQLNPVVFKRCKYMIEEIDRVGQAAKAMERQDWQRLGQLLYATHEGLQHEFEISCEEIDFLVDYTRHIPEILGSRMMGGGFGGCSINLIKDSYVERFSKDIREAYQEKFGVVPDIYPVNTASGTSEIIDK